MRPIQYDPIIIIVPCKSLKLNEIKTFFKDAVGQIEEITL